MASQSNFLPTTSFKPTFQRYEVTGEPLNYKEQIKKDGRLQTLVKLMGRSVSHLDNTEQLLLFRMNNVALTILNFTTYPVNVECYTRDGRAKVSLADKVINYFSPDSCHIVIYNEDKENKKCIAVVDWDDIDKCDGKCVPMKHSLELKDDKWEHLSLPVKLTF